METDADVHPDMFSEGYRTSASVVLSDVKESMKLGCRCDL